MNYIKNEIKQAVKYGVSIIFSLILIELAIGGSFMSVPLISFLGGG